MNGACQECSHLSTQFHTHSYTQTCMSIHRFMHTHTHTLNSHVCAYTDSCTHTHTQTEQQCRLPHSNVILTLSSNTHLRFHQLLLDLSQNCKFCPYMMLHFDVTTAVKKKKKKRERERRSSSSVTVGQIYIYVHNCIVQHSVGWELSFCASCDFCSGVHRRCYD